MKAMVLEEIGRSLVLRDLPIPEPAQGQVRIKIRVWAGDSETLPPESLDAAIIEERSIKSMANLTRQDGIDFFELAPRVPVRTHVQTFPLERANEALESLRKGQIHGAAVLVMDHET